jgi:tripartite-type tricarboxylate transporter receptor subunit TctC
MNKRFSYLVKLVICLALVVGVSTAAFGDDFYRGKTIRLIVGFSPGGGFDTYTRLIARHLGKHVPGNPTTLVQNMTGAGSLIAANYMYNRAKPDGLTIANFHGSLALQQVLGGKGIQFDIRKFDWLGVPVKGSSACALTTASGITSMNKWFAAKEPVKLGGTAPGGTTSDIPRILKAALGLPIKLVEGYGGTAKIRLAAEGGEVAGGCWQWESIKATWRKGLESGEVKVVLQALPKKHPELPDVSNAIDYAKSDDARLLIKLGIHDPSAITRYYSLPPGVPRDRVIVLQKAFMETLRDPKLLEEAKRSNLDLDPLTGQQVKEIIDGMLGLKPDVVAKLKEVLVPKKL